MADDLFGGNGDLWFGYTQVSWWQLFNGAISAPFRETNYEPEAHLSFLTGYDLAGLNCARSTSAWSTSRTAAPSRCRAAGTACSPSSSWCAATSP
jgi:hypothetical protein